MNHGMERNRLIRLLCTALVAAVLALALILVVAVCSGIASGGVLVETTGRGFLDLLPDGPIDPDKLPETIDWEDWTRDPDETKEPETETREDEPTYEPVTDPDDPPEDTLEPWESGLEWPTLPPSVEPDPDYEWPTLPEGWETLPEDWETLPEDWGVDLLEDGNIAEQLAGMAGNLGMPQGALGAGIASQLTIMKLLAEQDDRLYLKMQSFGAYNGQGWETAVPYTDQFNSKYSAVYLPHLAMNRVDQERGFSLWIDPIMDVRVIPYFLTTSHASGEMQYGDVKARGSTDQPYTLFYRHYAAYSVGDPQDKDPYLQENKLYTFERLYRSHVYNRYTILDETTEAYMNLIIREQGFDKNDPDIVEKVAEYIQNAAVYNLNYNQNLDQEPNVALAFLGAYKEGVCRHFASAATLLYRALGIPARYTVGFMTDVKGGEITAVKGEDAHAWVEVYEDGFGWRYVEVTGLPAQDDPDLPPETDTAPGTGEDTEPVVEPSTWGDVVAGVNGQFGLSASVPPAVLNGTVFRVTAEDSVRHFLKLKSFGDYTGQGWLNAEEYPLLYLSTYSPSYLGGSVIWATGEAPRHMTVVSPMGTVGIPYYISPETSGAGIQVGDNRMTGNGKTPYDVYYFSYADVTALDAQSFKHRDALLAYSAQLEEYVRENYTYLDDETRAYMDAIVEEQGWDPKDLRLADKVAAYVKGAADYREDYDKALNTEDNVVAAFLFEYGEGSSRHFAAAATLLFRAMGIPARYTVGYIADTVAGETVAVKGTDAYAWVEIYREGFGWVAVDVTPAGDYRPTVTLRPVTVRQKHNGTTLHASNVLTGFEEYEKQGYTYEAVVSGSLSVLGSAQSVIRSVELFDPQGNNVTDDFRIQLETGVIFVYMAAFTFGTDDYSKVYDGKPLTLTEEEVMLLEADTHNGKLPANLQYVVVPLAEPRDVGTGVLAFDVKIMYKKYDAQDTLTDQTEDYYIRRIYGRYTISPAEITLKAVDAQKTYDGTPLTAQGIEVAGGMLADGDYIAEYTVEGSRTRVGRSDNVITGVVIRNADGEDVTHNYAIETVVGTLRVTSP